MLIEKHPEEMCKITQKTSFMLQKNIIPAACTIFRKNNQLLFGATFHPTAFTIHIARANVEYARQSARQWHAKLQQYTCNSLYL